VLQILQQGFTTGWSGILPAKKQPALVTSGGKQTSSAQSTSIASKSTTASAGPSANASTSVISSTGELDDDMGAGRRRKMRKKKR
jgi:hypothetical protein